LLVKKQNIYLLFQTHPRGQLLVLVGLAGASLFGLLLSEDGRPGGDGSTQRRLGELRLVVGSVRGSRLAVFPGSGVSLGGAHLRKWDELEFKRFPAQQ